MHHIFIYILWENHSGALEAKASYERCKGVKHVFEPLILNTHVKCGNFNLVELCHKKNRETCSESGHVQVKSLNLETGTALDFESTCVV